MGVGRTQVASAHVQAPALHTQSNTVQAQVTNQQGDPDQETENNGTEDQGQDQNLPGGGRQDQGQVDHPMKAPNSAFIG